MLEQSIIDKLNRLGLQVYRPDPDAEHHPLPLYLSRIPAGFPSPADDHIDAAWIYTATFSSIPMRRFFCGFLATPW